MVSTVRATAVGIGAGGPLPAGSVVVFDWGDRSEPTEARGALHQATHDYQTSGTFRIRARAFTRGGRLLGGPGFGTFNTSTPGITNLTPATGPAAGGTTVLIDGVNLTGATTVFFGPTPATNMQVLNDRVISCVNPPGTGVQQVAVMIPPATNGLPFVYQPGDVEEPDETRRATRRRHG
jgi:hypothetical protein